MAKRPIHRQSSSGLAAGIFGSKALGGMGGVSFLGQFIGSFLGVAIALVGGIVVYGLLKAFLGIRMSHEEEYDGADLSIHRISSTPDREPNW
jgi:Amt family ammonium transporter